MKRLSAFLLAAVLLCAGCSKERGGFADQGSEEVKAADAELRGEFLNGSILVYPDYYGGSDIDGEKLLVYVTSDYNSELDFLPDKYGCVEFVEVEYGRNELYMYEGQIKTELEESFPELGHYNGMRIDEASNKVIVELLPATLDNAEIMDRLRAHFEGSPIAFGETPAAYGVLLVPFTFCVAAFLHRHFH